jgi:hypothetical protein
VDVGAGHYVACPVRPFKAQRSRAAVLRPATATEPAPSAPAPQQGSN